MKYKKSEVFQRTYESYLRQIQEIDFLAKADILGLEKDGDRLLIPLYNTTYSFSQNGIETRDGIELPVSSQVMICKYILTCPDVPATTGSVLLPYREFKNAAPLVSHFATTTTLAIENHFSGRSAELEQRCKAVGGEQTESQVYDLSFRFYAFPRIPVILNFNDKDEMFPAACSVLYYSSAENYLDMECLCMTGSHLANLLIG